jgi:hypothetical protein
MPRQCCWPETEPDHVSFTVDCINEITIGKCQSCRALLYEAVKDLQPKASDSLRVAGGSDSITVAIEPGEPWCIVILTELKLSRTLSGPLELCLFLIPLQLHVNLS